MIDYNYLLKMENEFERFLNEQNISKNKIILYGAGNGADWAVKLLEKYKLYPIAIIDRDSKKIGGKYHQIPIVSLNSVINKYNLNDVNILICSPRFEREIFLNLKKIFCEKNIYSFECALYYSFIENINDYKKYIKDNLKNLDEFEEKLSDEKSKYVFENVLKGRVSGKLKYFKKAFSEDQYFPEGLIQLFESDVIVDVGAYSGDTIKDIIKRTNGIFKKAYCMEPDKNCLYKLKKFLEENNVKNVQIIPKGAWNKREKVQFLIESVEEGSKILNFDECIHEDKNIYEIETEKIDNIISSQVTLIKMDIEGAELNALIGAKNTIKKYKPKLAISVYHKIEDFIEISQYIMKLNPNYRLYLRHHGLCGTDTVLYAINKE